MFRSWPSCWHCVTCWLEEKPSSLADGTEWSVSVCVSSAILNTFSLNYIWIKYFKEESVHPDGNGIYLVWLVIDVVPCIWGGYSYINDRDEAPLSQRVEGSLTVSLFSFPETQSFQSWGKRGRSQQGTCSKKPKKRGRQKLDWRLLCTLSIGKIQVHLTIPLRSCCCIPEVLVENLIQNMLFYIWNTVQTHTHIYHD